MKPVRTIRWGIASVAALAVLAAGGAVLMPAASAAAADVTVSWTITQDWGTGYQGSATVTNNTAGAISPWRVTVPYPNQIGSAWDAQLSAVTGGYSFSGPAWATSLAPGASATFGFIGSPRPGGTLAPASCTVAGLSCAVSGSPTASTASSTAPTPAASTATPVPTATAEPTTPPASASGVALSIKVTQDWGSGRTVDMVITNTGTTSINGWSVSFPWQGTGVSMWNATSTVSSGTLTARNLSWNAALAPGASVPVGFTDSGSFVMPATCTASTGPCQVVGSGSTGTSATPTSSPTSSPTAPATASPSASMPYVPAAGDYTGGRRIIAYYPAWATYARDFQVADIPAGKVTHINYAFANIQNGKCVLGDSYADVDKAFAGDTWDAGALRGNFNQLNKLKATHPQLRSLISIGGWTWSSNFSAAASTASSRAAFVTSCVDFMKTYGFNGIDIDWEYPVSGGLSGGTTADTANFTALLTDFRAALDAQGRAEGKHYDLTIAAPAGPSIIKNLDVAAIAKPLDWMNVMSYDFHGSWDPRTGNNAPLVVGTNDTAKGFSITDAVNTYLNRGMPAAKIVLGVPFYGRGWVVSRGVNGGLYQSATPASVGTWENGVFDYSDIVANYLPRMTRMWDAEAQVPYLYDARTGLWISYDDAQSMRAKAAFISSKGLGGAMIWEISGDRTSQLLDTLVTAL